MSSHRAAVIEVTRGNDKQQYLESRHLVDIVVADTDGNVVETWGDGERGVFPRSAIKALQALPLVESGAADTYGFSTKQVAMACSSHNGEMFQTKEAEAMLRQCGLSVTCLECGTQLPFHPKDHEMLIRAGIDVSAIHNNCSGKHSGFLAFAASQDLPIKGYVHYGHPVQVEIAGVLEQVTGAKHGEDNYGIDGCSIPTYEIPIANLATAFARLGVGMDKGKERSKAMRRIRDACMEYPEMVAGTGRFDTELMRAVPGRAFTKTGAEGVFTIAIPELGVGAALKCHDGSTRAAEIACATVVESLLDKTDSGLSETEGNALKELTNPVLKNWNGFVVGSLSRAAHE